MTLRNATPADRDAVVALAMHFHEASPYGGLLVVDPEFVIAQFEVAMAHGVVVVAQADDSEQLIGFFALAALIHGLSGERYADEMAWWVEPAYRSGTVGPQLLRRAEEWAQEHGCAFLTVAAPVAPRRVRLRAEDPLGRFYELEGYRPIETAYFKRWA